ncbi:flagellar assembly protein A [Sporosarcina beigongshangi]|uniref:flagellar assembly protein A n=1 Tax=Sporosarcina beigongshangi TaxID=2782538 RepID=UPI00193934F8|nr:FapA family protein [Sporosarcina beigongshangi]
MGKSISVKAETVEQAVEMALSILELTIEEVHVEVVSNPKRNLFGLRKMMAEVTVTQLESESLDETVEQYVNMEIPSEKKDDQEVVGARILNGKIDVLFDGDNYPVILPGKNCRVEVNYRQVLGRTILSPDDKVHVIVSDELIPPQFSIQLLEQDMLAMLSFTPGKKVKRTIHDTEFKQVLQIEAVEEIDYYNDLKPQLIVDRLKAMGIHKGLLFPAIKKLTEVIKPYEIIVAKGVPPVEGLDGDLEMHIDYKEKTPGELEKVDFRELNLILSVEAGQVIATYIPSVPGTDGVNLLGQVVAAEKVKDIVIRPGKNVSQLGTDIVAEISGRPAVDWREKLVTIEVNPEHFHAGEVDLESGNIRFEGDVRIGGGIQTSMYVGATGTIFVSGAVTKATIHAMKSAVVMGNVFSSRISVGQQEFIIGELTMQLKEIIVLLEQIQDAIQRVLVMRGNEGDDLTTPELNHLIRLLLEKKYPTFQELNKDFIQKVKNNAQELSPEWTDLANKFYSIFVTAQHTGLEDADSFTLLIEETRDLLELYGAKMSQALLTVPYAINSVLYSSGMIEVTSKGVYHSSVTAGDSIKVKGVCRGGEIIATHKISLQETGSENLVKTVVRTGEKGMITIGLAHAGTEIQIGQRHYTFMDKKLGVHAYLDDDGDLVVN